jgi:hypothetical protein
VTVSLDEELFSTLTVPDRSEKFVPCTLLEKLQISCIVSGQ